MLFPLHLYYNKKIEINKYFNIINYYHSNFIKKLSDGLPAYFDAVDRKNAKKEIIKKEEGIKKKFIFFNSKVIKFLIIDIDNKREFKKMIDIFEFLNDYNLIPSWILETNKGFHVAFILKKAIPYENEKAVEFARDTLKKLSLLLGGDPFALRLKGRFRNPLMHNTFYTDMEYDLIDLIDNIPDVVLNDIEINHNPNKKIHNNVIKLKELVLKTLNDINEIKNIHKGFRNAFLWHLGMMIAKNFQNLPIPTKLKEFEKIEEKIYFYNNNLNNPLEKKEIARIIKNIKKYYMKRKIMIGIGKYENWTPEMKRIYMRNYLKEKGKIKHHREEKKEINKNKILQAIYKLRSEKKKISARKVAEIAKIGKTTAAKYIKELKEDPKFSPLFNKQD